MKTTIKTNLVAQVVSIKLTANSFSDAKGICELSGKEREFNLDKSYDGDIAVTVKGIDVVLLNDVGIEVDFSYIIAAYKVIAAKHDEDVAKNKITKYEDQYDNHLLQAAMNMCGTWKLSHTKEEYVADRLKYSRDVLKLTYVCEAVQKTYKIIVNEKGQYVLSREHHYDALKTSKYFKNIISAFNEDVVSWTKRQLSAKKAKAEKLVTKKTVAEELSEEVITVSEYHSAKHRGSKSYSIDRLCVVFEVAEYEHATTKVTFTKSDKGYDLKDLRVGTMTADQMKQLIAIFK